MPEMTDETRDLLARNRARKKRARSEREIARGAKESAESATRAEARLRRIVANFRAAKAARPHDPESWPIADPCPSPRWTWS